MKPEQLNIFGSTVEDNLVTEIDRNRLEFLSVKLRKVGSFLRHYDVVHFQYRDNQSKATLEKFIMIQQVLADDLRPIFKDVCWYLETTNENVAPTEWTDFNGQIYQLHLTPKEIRLINDNGSEKAVRFSDSDISNPVGKVRLNVEGSINGDRFIHGVVRIVSAAGNGVEVERLIIDNFMTAGYERDFKERSLAHPLLKAARESWICGRDPVSTTIKDAFSALQPKLQMSLAYPDQDRFI